MQTQIDSPGPSHAAIWTGRILSAVTVLFLLFDGVIHLLVIAPVADALGRLGYPVNFGMALGIVEIVCVILYVTPLTSIFGAILLTGYLGGAVAVQLRIGAPLMSTALFPVYVGLLIWAGLCLRDKRLRALIPLRKTESA